MRKTVLFLVCLWFTVLTGYATTKSYAADNSTGYEKFFDSRGDQKLVRRSNDIYLEKLDGSDSKQITHTPDIKEGEATFFVGNGRYIVYYELRPAPSFRENKCYIQKTDETWEERKEISSDEYTLYWNEWQARVK